MDTYIKWDAEKHTHIGTPSNVQHDETWLKCLLPPYPRTSETQELKWLFLEGTHENYLHGYWEGSENPLDAKATVDDINRIHRELEISPIEIAGEIFDCDERSELRMRDAVTFWDYRPLETGIFEELPIQGEMQKVITWIRGDNTATVLTKFQLSAIYQEILLKRAVRGAILFSAARKFKENPETTVGDISNPINWGI